MPLLDDDQVRDLLRQAYGYARCPLCGHLNAVDYDRSADEFYAIHSPECPRYDHKRSGHRFVLIPFVEAR